MEINDQLISTIRSSAQPTLIGVSGFGGSGKSTFAKKLGEAIGAPVVGVDSFQKKGAFDTEYSLWEIMGYTRLEQEVLQPFHRGEEIIRYGDFDAFKEMISNTIEIKNNRVLITEGVGLFRPKLMKYFTYTIWIDVPLEKAIERGKRRDQENGSSTDELWDGIWKENDLQYMNEFNPKENADSVISNI